jgi:transposase
VLEAVLWILNTGAQWHMLPQSYPNYKTVHRRFQTWCRDEVLRRVLTDVANELRDRGALNEEECFIDGRFLAWVLRCTMDGRKLYDSGCWHIGAGACPVLCL